MKRILGLMTAALLLAAPAGAMDNLHAGIRGGLNVANINADPDEAEQTDSRNGLALGGWVAFPVNEMFSVQPEALFMMKGDSQTTGDVTSTVSLNYIEIPVLAKVKFMPDASAQPSIFAGPAIAFNASAKAKLEGSENPDDDFDDMDVKDSFKSVDFGLVFGGGLDIPVGSGKNELGIDVRYNLGLTDVNNLDVEGFTSPELKTGTLTVMGSFSFI